MSCNETILHGATFVQFYLRPSILIKNTADYFSRKHEYDMHQISPF